MTITVQSYETREHPILRGVQTARNWYSTRTHDQALAAITAAIDHRKGYACVIGEAGSGKTAVLNAYAAYAELGFVRAVKLDGRCVSSRVEFIAAILKGLRVDVEGKASTWLHRRLQLAARFHIARDKPLALLVDDADALDDETLSQLHLLIDSPAGQESVLQIVLAGTRVLEKRLRTPLFEPVDQRIGARCRLEPIDAEKRVDFIHAMLARESLTPGIALPQQTLRRIARKSRGNPATIVALTRRSLERAQVELRPLFSGPTGDAQFSPSAPRG